MMAPAQPGKADPGTLGRQPIRQAGVISPLRHDFDRLASEITDSIADPAHDSKPPRRQRPASAPARGSAPNRMA
jgi:hypothetical protein